MVNFFHCKKLDRLHKEGQLDAMFDLLSKKINRKTWLGSGSEAAAFFYQDQVIKVCPKSIRYFKEAGHLSAETFQNQVNQLQPFLVPINKVLYEDDQVMVYTQDKCQLIKDYDYKSPYIVISFLQLIIFMFENNELISDIGPHNLGVLDGHLVVFDYHGLHPIIRNNKVRKRKWWKRPITNLTNFINYLNYKDEEFPQLYAHFLNMLNYCKTPKDLGKCIKILHKCLQILLNLTNLRPELKHLIMSRQKYLLADK